jgi:hypothetical protein
VGAAADRVVVVAAAAEAVGSWTLPWCLRKDGRELLESKKVFKLIWEYNRNSAVTGPGASATSVK